MAYNVKIYNKLVYKVLYKQKHKDKNINVYKHRHSINKYIKKYIIIIIGHILERKYIKHELYNVELTYK